MLAYARGRVRAHAADDMLDSGERDGMVEGTGTDSGRDVSGGQSTTGEPAGMASTTLRFMWEWTRSLFLALVLFLLVRTFVVEAFKIPTSSMEGTLLVGDFLLVNKAAYGAEIPFLGKHLPAWKEPQRGDVVVFNPPHDPLKNYVKRVVGVPGDTLEMHDKALFVNGFRLEEPYARHIDRSGADATHPTMSWQRNHLLAGNTDRRPTRNGGYRPSRDNWGPISVPPGKYFVLGDNRDNSEDSRYWGFADREAITGQPWIVYFSFNPASSERLPWLQSVRWGRIGGRIR